MARILFGLLMVVWALILVSRLSQGGTDVPSPPVRIEVEPPQAGPIRAVERPRIEATAPIVVGATTPASTPTIDRMARLEGRRRLFQSGRHTYIDSLLVTSDSVVRRWVPQPGQPLRVAIALPDSFASHRSRTTRAIQTALDRWAALRLGVIFQVVGDTSLAEIVVHWIDRFDIDRSGQADIQFGSDGVIHSARITLALRMVDGRLLEDDQLGIVATHEVGHALGMPHSDRPADVMYPTAELDGLSARDRATATLIYSVIPGSMAEPVVR